MGSNSSLPDYNPDDYINDSQLDLSPFSYPNMGNYTLENMPLKELARADIHRQMEFSDAICRRYAKNPLFISQQIPLMLSMDFRASDLNETSIGNMAFMAYHNPHNQQIQEAYSKTIRACL